ncbi:MAG: ATP-binding protein [Chitinophagales bacterium]|nr:ATP-binding protein [Chitinophagales bacterium]
MHHSLESWLTLFSSIAILLMGMRVYFLDTTQRVNFWFMLAAFFLFIQNLCFYEMLEIETLAVARKMRTFQETVWNLAAMSIYMTTWYYAKKYMPSRPSRIQTYFFWFILSLFPVFIFLEACTPYGHGEVVAMGNGKWGIIIHHYKIHDWFRAVWVFLSYAAGIYFSTQAYIHNRNEKTKKGHLWIVLLLGVILTVTFIQNYILTAVFGIISPINETGSVIFAIIVVGMMFSNFRLFEVRSEYAINNILNTMTNWGILTDTHFQIQLVNKSLVQALGKREIDFLNMHITSIFPSEQWDVHEQSILAISTDMKDSQYQCEFRLQLNSKIVDLLFTATPIVRNKLVRGYVFVGTDLTVFKESARRIEAYAQQLERSNEALERFAYIASHDLKEPIRNIGNFTGLIKKRYGDKLDESGREYLAFIQQSAKGMDALIDAVMAVSRLGQDAMNWVKVDLNIVLEDTIKGLDGFIRDRQAIVEYSKMPMVQGDPYMLKQLFQNLIENGIKYNTAAHPQIQIYWKKMDDEKGSYKFTVNDNGIGVEEEYREHIFEMFKRLHPRGEYEGTGIGLAICRRIVELHNGEISVRDNKSSVGSVFCFTLSSKPDHSYFSHI